jgi:aspartate racemase
VVHPGTPLWITIATSTNADATGTAIQKKGLKKVGLMGTLYTMQDGYITDWLKERYGIETVVPESVAARQKIPRIIQQEIDLGVFKPESKKYILEQIEELRKRGAQSVVLGCTELPLIIKQADTTFPVFDTTLMHSQMAVDFILGKPGLAHVQSTP